MNRPDNWIAIRNEIFASGNFSRKYNFEAGADAMLQAQRKDGLTYPPNPIYLGDMLDYRDGIFRFLDDKAQGRYGHIVFIPEEG